MNVQLPPDLETFVESEIQAGHYSTPNDVIREALRLLEERDHILQDRREEFRRMIEEGAESLDRGEFFDGEEVVAELDAMLEERERSGAAE